MANKVQINGYFYNALKSTDPESGEVTYDRLYNSEEFCAYLDKLIGNGVFPTPSTQLAVSANNNMTISVAPGDAWMQGRKVSNDAIQTLDISASNAIFDRIDRIVIYTDNTTERAAGIKVLTGTAIASPVAPALTRNDDIYEMALADIRVKAGATTISAGDITDQRPNSSVCGWVAGLIQQIDISSLYAQWAAAYNGLYQMMEDWQSEMQNQFDTWFYNMNSSLTVGAYIRTFKKTVVGSDTATNVIPLDMTGYEYDINDVIFINFNGFFLLKDVDYTLTINGGVASVTLNGDMTEGNNCEITILKSSMAQTTNGYLTRVKGDKFLHIDDAIPGEVNTFIVTNQGQDNTIIYTNKNLVPASSLQKTEVNGFEFLIYSEGIIEWEGEGIDDVDSYMTIELDRNLFQYANHYIHLAFASTGDEFAGYGEMKLVVTYKNASNQTLTETVTQTANYPSQKFIPPSIRSTPLTESQYNIQSVVVKIGLPASSAGGTEMDAVFLYPMMLISDEEEILFDTIVSEGFWEPGTRDTFTYDGVTKPDLKSISNTVYSTDNDVSGLLMVYLLDGTSIVNGDDALYPQNS